jgi:hypothetical protein
VFSFVHRMKKSVPRRWKNDGKMQAASILRQDRTQIKYPSASAFCVRAKADGQTDGH